MEKDTIDLVILVLLIIIIFAITLIVAYKRDQKLIYVHTKKGTKYRIIQDCLVKIDGTWVDGVVYVNDHTGEMYVRSLIDFTKNFKRLAEWEQSQQ